MWMAADYRRGGRFVLAEPSRKLDVHTRGEANAKAVRFGLTAAPPTT
jgi:hypothetical protein